MLERSGWRTRRLDRKHAVVVIVRSWVPRPGGRMRRQQRRRIHDDDSPHRPGGIDRCRGRTAAQQHQAAEAGARPVHRKPVASKLDRPDHRPGEPGDRTAVRPGGRRLRRRCGRRGPGGPHRLRYGSVAPAIAAGASGGAAAVRRCAGSRHRAAGRTGDEGDRTALERGHRRNQVHDHHAAVLRRPGRPRRAGGKAAGDHRRDRLHREGPARRGRIDRALERPDLDRAPSVSPPRCWPDARSCSSRRSSPRSAPATSPTRH